MNITHSVLRGQPLLPTLMMSDDTHLIQMSGSVVSGGSLVEDLGRARDERVGGKKHSHLSFVSVLMQK